MTRYMLLVCLPASSANPNLVQVRQEIAQRLAPFEDDIQVPPRYRRYLSGTPAEFAQHHQVPVTGEPAGQLTWQHVIAAYNDTLPVDDPRRLHVDERGGYYLSHANPEGRWSEWVIGGGWSGHLWAKPDAPIERLINPRPQTLGPTGPLSVTRCDGGPLSLLDVTTMRVKVSDYASCAYRQWERITRGTPPALSRDFYANRHLNDPDRYPLAQAENDYLAQPRIAAITRYQATGPHDSSPLLVQFTPAQDRVIQLFQQGEQTLRLRAADAAAFGHGLLTLHGEWIGPGRSTDLDALDFPTLQQRLNSYYRNAHRYLNSVQDDTRLIVIDCRA